MNKKEFINLFDDKTLELPIESNDEDVCKILNDLYESYNNRIDIFLKESKLKKGINDICTRILESIKSYYLGTPCRAFEILTNTMDSLFADNAFVFYTKNDYSNKFTLSDPLKLYRVRSAKEKDVFSHSDTFHVPFSKRRRVSSSRFSIAGHPSLYLGTSLELSRIETDLKKSDKYIASRFQIDRHINNENLRIMVLDLSLKPNGMKELNFFNYENMYLSNELFIKSYLEIYPLIAACSIMVEEKNKNFYPEYIIPQLIMQWLLKKSKQEDNVIYGIRYFTCRSKTPRIKGFNYVFPVSSIPGDLNDKDYCRVLAKIFKFSKPVLSTENGFEDVLEESELVKLEI